MDKIIIESIDGSKRIVMPRVRNVSVGGVLEKKSVSVASGESKAEVVGYRTKITASWDWLPEQTIRDLLYLLRSEAYFKVYYPDPVIGDTSGEFEIEYPTTKVFKYNNGNPRWHDITLNMTARKVI